MSTPHDAPSHTAPPGMTERILTRLLAGTPYQNDIVGDLHESHNTIAERRSPRYAAWW